MQFIFDGKAYKAIKITGPTHNLLGLVFDNNGDNDIEVLALGQMKDREKAISPSDVKNQVFSGLKEANHAFKVNYRVKQIQFIPSDTPSANVYKELTIEIIKRLVLGG
jgi:hypothetical protein